MAGGAALGSRPLPRARWRAGVVEEGAREVAEEAAVALVYQGSTHAVLMATPADLADLALGFSLTEGVVARADEIEATEIVEHGGGIEVRMWLAPERAHAAAERRRALAGPTGCGLCGIESLAEALRPAPLVTADLHLARADVHAALAALAGAQPLGRATRAVHGAGFWTPADGLIAVREDVGRHNALDKLAGALAQAGRGGGEGAVVLTSRVSVEMVQKAARVGASVLIAISAPTALAVATAEAAGVTLIAVARDDGFELFTHPHRIARR